MSEFPDGKSISALDTVAAGMTQEELHEQRGEDVERVEQAAATALAQDRLERGRWPSPKAEFKSFDRSKRFEAKAEALAIERAHISSERAEVEACIDAEREVWRRELER